MKTMILILTLLAGCLGDNTEQLEPDAMPSPDATVDAGLPLCLEISCINRLVRDENGVCTCVLPETFEEILCYLPPPDSVAYAVPVDVYVIALQSNAVGPAKTTDLPPSLAFYAQSYPSVEQAYQINCPKDGIDGPCAGVHTWQPLKPRGSAFGVELSLGRVLDARNDRPVALIKTATNGTNVNEQWQPDPPTGKWQWNYMTEFVDAQIALLPSGSRVAGVFLVGFEGDALQASTARAVAAELVFWVMNFRDRYGDVPVVVSEVSAPGLNYSALTSVGQWRAADHVPGLFIVETGDMTYKDGIHYTAPSAIELGLRMGAAMPVGGG